MPSDTDPILSDADPREPFQDDPTEDILEPENVEPKPYEYHPTEEELAAFLSCPECFATLNPAGEMWDPHRERWVTHVCPAND